VSKFGATVAAVAALAAGGCGGSAAVHHVSSRAAPAIAVSSTFAPGAVIPKAYTCDGVDRSPPLRATGVPARTVEVVVVMRDPDAPGGDFIHWAIAHVSPGAGGTVTLVAGRDPPGAVLGRNSFGSLGYRGPCPPAGDPSHHYKITLSALGKPSRVGAGFPTGALDKLHVLATGTLTGTYSRR
jgi:Raf kinase inhibitor-like YbhB/YbcL family protein